MRTIRIGSRESRLAVVQSEMVLEYLGSQHPELNTELITMKTTGDVILDKRLDKIGGKGLFVKELDKALAEGRSDLSVHSAKDLPARIDERLPLVGFSKREDPRDVLVLPKGADEWDKLKPVGCSSLRRMLQLKSLYPEVVFETVRGNVQTRLGKLDGGQYGALILAAAGLKRLGLEERISRYFTVDEMIPASCQGILALQGRAGVDYSFMDGFIDQEASDCAMAERAYIDQLDGGCSSPVACFGEIREDQIFLRALYYSEDKKTYVTGSLTADRSKAAWAGRQLAIKLKAKLDGPENFRCRTE